MSEVKAIGAAQMAQLASKFPAHCISFRMSERVDTAQNLAQALPYLDPQAVKARFDEVLGAENWEVSFQASPVGTGTICSIGVLIGGVKVTKQDGVLLDASKGVDPRSLETAFKRAAAMWGVGRYLFELPIPVVAVVKTGESYAFAEAPSLPAAFLPGGNGGVYSTLTEDGYKPAPVVAAPAAAPAPAPAKPVARQQAPTPTPAPAPAPAPVAAPTPAPAPAPVAVQETGDTGMLDGLDDNHERLALAAGFIPELDGLPADAPADAVGDIGEVDKDGIPIGLMADQDKTLRGLLQRVGNTGIALTQLVNYIGGEKVKQQLGPRALICIHAALEARRLREAA